MPQTFRQRLLEKEKLIGTILSLPSPEIAEIFSAAGFDWLFVDLEHGAISISGAMRILQASTVPCILRCPSNDKVWIKKCLDIGADGLIIPMVNSKAEAEQAISWSKYPPDGSRGVGVARAQGYGKNFDKYLSEANHTLSMILQIEHIEGVHNIDGILEVNGIDCIFIGPYDLSASMDLTGEVEHPEVVAAIDNVTKACKERNIPLGIYAGSASKIKAFEAKGYSLFAVGTEATLLGNAAAKVLKELKD